ncbi:hypothetical protein G6O67_001448 [Ophiocordyceps sinensis]|uniref:Uncharacterized protein n=1 Tax=Ophiocordyceps sinensis TaxID=72228 RepID=A0A8H4V982_9HYPO|nr:hypothetical protein G6O67_001448 [Ophiocordyceps sinensis]
MRLPVPPSSGMPKEALQGVWGAFKSVLQGYLKEQEERIRADTAVCTTVGQLKKSVKESVKEAVETALQSKQASKS